MRTVYSLAIASILLTACGIQDDRPRAAIVYPEQGASRSPIVSTVEAAPSSEKTNDSSSEEGDADGRSPSCTPKTCAAQGWTCGTLDDGCGGTEECGTCSSGSACTNDGGGVCGSMTSICSASTMRLFGSCVAANDGPLFSNGAECIEFHDSRSTATAAEKQWACECKNGVWSTESCAVRVGPRECSIESSSTTCSRAVSCWPKG